MSKCSIRFTYCLLSLPLVRFDLQLQLINQIQESGDVLLVLLSLETIHNFTKLIIDPLLQIGFASKVILCRLVCLTELIKNMIFIRSAVQTAVQSLTRLPVMFEAVGRAVSIETETINRNMDSIMEKLTALQRKIDGIGDQNGQRE